MKVGFFDRVFRTQKSRRISELKRQLRRRVPLSLVQDSVPSIFYRESQKLDQKMEKDAKIYQDAQREVLGY